MQTERIQTAIRLDADLYNRIRRRAHIEKRSINSYIEKVLDDHTKVIYPASSPDLTISEVIRSMAGSVKPRKFTQEELDADPKLAYLVKKLGL